MLEDSKPSRRVDELMDIFGRYKLMEEILQDFWNDVGPYGGTVTYENDSLRKLRDFIGFDDSE